MTKEEKHNEKQKKYYFLHKEQKKAYDKIYIANHKEKINKRQNLWSRKNRKHLRSYHERWRDAHRENIKRSSRKANLKKLFGLTIEQYNQMFVNQNGLCAICKRTCVHNLCVDHCHTTGKVRGLLCDDCNFLLGRYKDDVDLIRLVLAEAIKYLNSSI